MKVSFQRCLLVYDWLFFHIWSLLQSLVESSGVNKCFQQCDQTLSLPLRSTQSTTVSHSLSLSQPQITPIHDTSVNCSRLVPYLCVHMSGSAFTSRSVSVVTLADAQKQFNNTITWSPASFPPLHQSITYFRFLSPVM